MNPNRATALLILVLLGTAFTLALIYDGTCR